MKVSINCPSYKRPKVETLDYLKTCKVWVAEREYDDYIKANKGIVHIDTVKNQNQKKQSKRIDYNPIIHIPIAGV